MAAHRTEPDRPGARPRVVAAVAGVLGWAGALVAAVLVADVLLTVGGANPANSITTTVATWADRFALGFRDLFTPADAKLRVLVNHGLAALFWLVVRSLALRLVRLLG
ncbi:hypothetical protein [Saccharothrix syringae]|uniref:Uncharacterized protein n=1 Tax=Saccharothrix syringae TaxID=103733 RepID=A0A5Q0GRW8_SACSY|nr:hypothetical protein [Saccharothrix syringae]QFZ16260.1 hypothetical protein EKG83_01215 [Saccharothrix syringae]